MVWDEKVEIPVLYGKEFSFEVFEKHEFGYNPDQFKNMLYGTLMINNVDEKFNSWDVLDSKKQKIGELSANIIQKSLKRSNSPVSLASSSKIQLKSHARASS